MKLRNKILLRYFILAALPLSLLLGFTFSQVRSLVNQGARNSVEAEVEALLSQIASFEQFVFERLNVIVTRRRLQEELLALRARETVLEAQDLNRILTDILWSSSALRAVSVFGPELQLLAHSDDAASPGIHRSLQEYMGRDVTPQEGVQLRLNEDKKLVAFGIKRFLADNGNLLGYIAIQSRGEELFDFLRAGQRLGSREKVYFIVRDLKEERFVVSFEPLLKSYETMSFDAVPFDKTLLLKAAGGQRFVRERWLDEKGILRSLGAGSLGTLNTTVLISVPREDLFWAMPLINRAFIVSTLLLVVVFPLGALLLAQDISSPISALARIVSDCKFIKNWRGGLDARGIDEIESLRRSFFSMTETLRSSHENLEWKVRELSEKNGLLKHEITAREQAAAALAQSEERYRSLVAATSSIVWLANPYGKFIELQPAWREFTGQAWVHHQEFGWLEAYHIEDKQHVREELERAKINKSTMIVEARLWNASLGRYRHTVTRAVPIITSENTIREWFGVVSDVHDKRMVAQQLAHSLREKEVLLREMHHRVKNNLQVITSLLRLQGGKIESGGAKDIFTESQNRLRSMALVHERLYESQSLADIDFSQYLTQLVGELHSALTPKNVNVALHLDLEDVDLEIEQAIPCGLIVNELVSNALRHDFVPETKGNLWVRLEHEDGAPVIVRISDDGTGSEGVRSFSHSSSLDMRIISTLTEQLEGTFEIKESDPGFDVTLSFPRTNSISRRTAYGNRAYYDL